MRDVELVAARVSDYRMARLNGMPAKQMPDGIIRWAGEHWDMLGYTPFIVFRILERGIPWEMLDRAMTGLVGPTWAVLSCTDWMDIIEAKGIETFDTDEPPFCDVMVDLILKYEFGWWR